MTMFNKKKSLFLCVMFAGLVGLLGNAYPFTININPGAELAANADALAAFNRAAAQWQTQFTDPISVNINADLSNLGPGILGSTSMVVLAGAYDLIRNYMVFSNI